MVEISRGRRVKPMRWRVDPSTVLLVLWGMFIVYGTLIPFAFTDDAGQVVAKLRLVGDAPNRPLALRRREQRPALLAMGGPLRLASGATGGGVLDRCPRRDLQRDGVERPGGDLPALRPQPHPSLVNLATNTAGAALGALAGWAFERRVWPTWSPRLTRLVNERPIAACTLAAAAGLVLAGLSPFDVSIDLGDLRAAVKRRGRSPSGRPWGGLRRWPSPGRGPGRALGGVHGGILALAMKEAGKGGPKAVAAAGRWVGPWPWRSRWRRWRSPAGSST